MRLVVGDLFEEPAQRRGAEPELGDSKRRLAELDALRRIQGTRSKIRGRG
jgi:hypothetical protein